MKRITILLVLITVVSYSCVKEKVKHVKEYNVNEYMLLSTAWYQISAERKALYHQAFNIAKSRINEISRQNFDKTPAVVLDIDETVLDNSPYQGWCIKNDSSFSRFSWNNWVFNAKAEALAGAVDFTNYAKNKGVEVIYISNRNISQIEPTIKNLKEKGFPNADKRFVFLKDSTSNKSYRRNKVNEKYEIALLVGDALGDFNHLYDNRKNNNAHKILEKQKELFGKKFIILPNPMYGKWVHPIQEINGNYVNNLKKQLKSF